MKKADQPTNRRAHEPMAELQDVIDLITMLGNVWRLAEKFVDKREASHIWSNRPRSVPRKEESAFAHDARDEN